MNQLMTQLLRYSLCLLLILGGGYGCQHKSRTYTLRILHTSDVHGNILGYDFAHDTYTQDGLSRIATYIAQVRKDNPNTTLLLEGGDILQGSPLLYYANFIDTLRPHIVSEAMTLLDYDVAIVGNHDLETTPTVYHRWQSDMSIPLLAANIVHSSGASVGKPYYSPYSVHNVEGVKVAVLGLITPSIPEWIPASSYEGMTFLDPIATASAWIDKIERHVHPDLLIALIHSGLGDEEGGENFAYQLATSVSDLDLILYGHDHQAHQEMIETPSGGSVLLMNPGSHAHSISDVTITIEKLGSKIRSKQIKGTIVPMSEIVADTTFLAHFSSFADSVRQFVAKPITYLTEGLSGVEALFGPSSYLSLLHQVQLEISGAQISFTAPHNISLELPADTLRVRDFFDLYPYENHLYKLQLSGQEVLNYLEYSYALWCGPKASLGEHILHLKDRTSTQRFPTAEPTFNFSSAAGIDYTVNFLKPQGERVSIEHLTDGTPFSLDSIYTVAINSYRAIGGGGHMTEGIGLDPQELQERVLWQSAQDLRYHIIGWAERQHTLSVPHYSNWSFVPQDKAAQAIQRDRLIIQEYLSQQ